MSQERTEQATPRKLRDARRRGEVAVSRDLTSSVLLLVFVAAGLSVGGLAADRLVAAAKLAFAQVGRQDLTGSVLLETLWQCGRPLGWVILLLLLVVAVVAVLVTFIQIGPVISGTPLLPKLERLNPAAGLKRMFFSLSTYVELLKMLLKAGLVCCLCWIAVESRLRDVLLSSALPPDQIAMLAAGIIRRLVLWVVVSLLGLGAIDLLWQRWQYHRRQRMTKEEVRREYEADEGKPEHRHARRHLHRQIATEAMLQEVPDADVVVVNPTQIACALRFDPQRENAPRLLAKGKGVVAERIRDIARREGVSITQNIPLARTLSTLELRATIPPDLYEVVKHVLLWVEEVARTQGRTPRWARHDPSTE